MSSVQQLEEHCKHIRDLADKAMREPLSPEQEAELMHSFNKMRRMMDELIPKEMRNQAKNQIRQLYDQSGATNGTTQTPTQTPTQSQIPTQTQTQTQTQSQTQTAPPHGVRSAQAPPTPHHPNMLAPPSRHVLPLTSPSLETGNGTSTHSNSGDPSRANGAAAPSTQPISQPITQPTSTLTSTSTPTSASGITSTQPSPRVVEASSSDTRNTSDPANAMEAAHMLHDLASGIHVMAEAAAAVSLKSPASPQAPKSSSPGSKRD
eukprot:TRINITY_DN476_c0_g4_i1.p1 TRINITY_DN476_c0_g4~~TRINITY_DN476_c0_g4_i1.p1  ORF type:complete len:263 (+),score=67.30 TRINITY_DN476_c0_g4_i1:59-847(+)